VRAAKSVAQRPEPGLLRRVYAVSEARTHKESRAAVQTFGGTAHIGAAALRGGRARHGRRSWRLRVAGWGGAKGQRKQLPAGTGMAQNQYSLHETE
jgi:hypothetical protein